MRKTKNPAAKVLWIGHRGEDSKIASKIGNLAGVICCDDSAALHGLPDSIPIHSVERLTGKRKIWTSSDTPDLSVQFLRKLTDRHAQSSALLVLPYKATKAIQAQVESIRSPRLELLAADAKLVAELDNKLYQRELFVSWGIPTPNFSTVKSDDALKHRLQALLRHQPGVVQPASGSLGKGVRLLRSPMDAEVWLSQHSELRQFLVSDFVPGPALNTTAVVQPDRIHISQPSVQILGSALGLREKDQFLFCGNDFASAARLAPAQLESLEKSVERLGKGLRGLGYRGIFGADWVLSPERGPTLIEVNPRLQGSTALLTALEEREGHPLTIREHLRAFCPDSVTEQPQQEHKVPPLRGSQVLVYTGSEDLARPAAAQNAPLGSEWLQRVQGLPLKGVTMESGALLGRIVAEGPALDAEMSAVKTEYLTLMAHLNRQFECQSSG